MLTVRIAKEIGKMLAEIFAEAFPKWLADFYSGGDLYAEIIACFIHLSKGMVKKLGIIFELVMIYNEFFN